MKDASKFFARLEAYCHRWWYLPMMALWAGADMFIGVVPTDGLLITSAALTPRRWIRVALWFTIGSSLGAVAMAATIEYWGEPLVQSWFGDSLQSGAWLQAKELLQNYGAAALIFVAVGPLPQQPAIVLCGLSGMPLKTVFGAVLIGRVLKYLMLSWISTHAPRLLGKFGVAQKEAQELQEHLPKDIDTR